MRVCAIHFHIVIVHNHPCDDKITAAVAAVFLKETFIKERK